MIRGGSSATSMSYSSPEITPGELRRLLCPNPYTCGGGSPHGPPPPEVRRTWKYTEYSPGDDDFNTVTPGDRRVVHLSCCCCDKLRVRYLNVYDHTDKPRVAVDPRRMMEVPGATVNDNGRHPPLFADCMAFAEQKLDVKGFKDIVLTHRWEQPAGDTTFPVVADGEDGGGSKSNDTSGKGRKSGAEEDSPDVREIEPRAKPERNLKVAFGGKKKLHASDNKEMARMLCTKFVINGVQYCRPHLMLSCHLCEENNCFMREEVDEERRSLGLRPGGDPRINYRAERWYATIVKEQMEAKHKFGELGDRADPFDRMDLMKELKANEKKLNERFLADADRALSEGASQCCYYACANPAVETLYSCSGCGIVKYCSKKHQALDWKWEHKVECTKSVPQFVLDEIQSDHERHVRGDYDKIER